MESLRDQVIRGKNFDAVQLGTWSDLMEYKLDQPKARGKVFLKDLLNFSGMEVSVNSFPPGVSMPFHHKHKENEEVYIFVKGSGQFQIDDTTIDVKEGTVIRVAEEGVRIWRNNSTENLYFICIQAKAGSLQSGTIEDGILVDQPIHWED
ncbi:cupin domain-containing protein [Brevibacillus ginsengisoli]|uniref:cupin domain-containing protein n=1 Tax=Brevibacillus ginsengisoli TaxID=363854 RepID=UPI003CE93D7F